MIKFLLEKRQYIQFIDVLGEVGGLMEIIYSFFGMICSFVGDILYEKTIANNLFSFNVNKKIIYIKKEENILFKFSVDKNKEEEKRLYSRILSPSSTKKIKRDKLMIMDTINIEVSDKNSGNNLIDKNNNLEKNTYNNEINLDNFENYSVKNNFKSLNKDSSKMLYKSTNKSKSNSINNSKNEWIINKINLSDSLFSMCFCFKRKRRSVYKLLLNETMNIIIEKFDIFNLFRDLCAIEKLKNNYKYDSEVIIMSSECVNNLQNISQ